MAQTGAEAIALAHHRDDQAEAFLLHLLRGAGTAGLSGMAEDSVVEGVRVLRPLLHSTRASLRSWLTQIGQPWREDSSNLDTGYLRNAIRLEVLPLLERLSPGAAEHISDAAELVRADAEMISAEAEKFLAAHAGTDWIRLDPLRQLPEPMQRAVLRRWWGRCARGDEHGLSRPQTERLLSLLRENGERAVSLPERRTARRGRSFLYLEPGLQAQDMEALPA